MKPQITKQFRLIYLLLGFFFLGLAILGIPLPVLPTTPFLLLAAWFFARSSKKWHTRLLQSALFGPMIRNWEAHHCISQKTKLTALSMMLVVGGGSVFFFINDNTVQIVAIALMLVGAVVILRIKTCPANACENLHNANLESKVV